MNKYSLASLECGDTTKSETTTTESDSDTVIQVLHVDDESAFLNIAKQCLEEEGFEVDIATSAEEALHILETCQYHVIISDYMLPGKNGLEFLKEIREKSTTPFVMLTGKGKEDVAIAALNAGADYYTKKKSNPAMFHELAQTLFQIVKTQTERELGLVKAIYEELPTAFLLYTAHGVLLDANRACLTLFGVPHPHKIRGIHLFNSLNIPEEMREALYKGKPVHYETFFDFEKGKEGNLYSPTKSGTMHLDVSITPVDFYHCHGYAVHIQHTRPAGVSPYQEQGLKNIEDLAREIKYLRSEIEDHKKVEKALRASEDKYCTIFEELGDAFLITNRDGTIADYNKAALDILGYTEEEIGTITSHMFYANLPDRATFQHIMESRGSVTDYEAKLKKKDGTLIDCIGTVILRRAEDGTILGYQGVFRDITKNKKAEKALRESQLKFKRLFMGNPEAAVYLDPDFHIVDINPQFKELFGYSLREVKGDHISVIVPEAKLQEAEKLYKKAAKRQAYLDTKREKKDKTTVPVSISAAPITVEDHLAGYIVLYKDISQLKRTEKALKRTLEKLEAVNEKLRVVGSMTRHDIRNKLSTVVGIIYLINKTYKDSALNPFLNDIEMTLNQIERIFDFAKTYEQVGVEEMTYIDVADSLKEAVMLLDMNNTVVINECKGLRVLADSLLRHIFYDLIDNSLKHGESVNTIRVYYTEEKDQVNLVYEDDGTGIPVLEKENIFTEGHGKDTGYGLYLIKKTCEAYGWTIKETGVGKGAQFTIRIPALKNGNAAYTIQ